MLWLMSSAANLRQKEAADWQTPRETSSVLRLGRVRRRHVKYIARTHARTPPHNRHNRHSAAAVC